MDALREQLVYKNTHVHICMSRLSAADQYECIRLLLATRTENVCVCKRGLTNSYIEDILTRLSMPILPC
jgi:hypothetical protein